MDCTAAAHPLVLRPLIERFEAEGHEVFVTAREYGQTVGILDRLGLPYTAVGEHGGASKLGKLRALGGRSARLARLVWDRRPDLALAHGSVDLAVVSRLFLIPSVQMQDYEFARLQRNVSFRAARRVLAPDSIPVERLKRIGAGPKKLVRYPGLKEEYYLADFEPDTAVLDELGLDPAVPIAVVRTPPDASLYHRHESPVFPRVLERLRDRAQTVVLPRTPRQREEIDAIAGGQFKATAAGTPRLIVPKHAIDAQSLIAHADLVVSGGGTMNREAVALGTPVFTTFEGRLGAVDEALLRDGRLRRLEDPDTIDVAKRTDTAHDRIRRNPRDLAQMLLTAVP